MAKKKVQSGKVKKWNSRIHYFLIAAFLLLVFVPMINKTPSKETEQKATDAAVRFLYLVDHGDYDESWQIASVHLQKTLPQDEWREKIAQIRGAVGPAIERSRDDITFMEASGDLPEGEYVVITFVSKFQNRSRVTESVTLYHGENGQWKVAGYYLK